MRADLESALKTAVRLAILFAAAFVATVVAVVWPRWVVIRDEAVGMVDAHLAYRSLHPGWSFPARVWSGSVPLDIPAARLVDQAKARGYAEACPPASPGEICAKTGEVLLRGGRFPDGVQPAGNEGWTRPLALEPVLIGTLVGPDGEIREHLPLQRAPAHLLAAVITSEDANFYEHSGVNVKGVLRAAVANFQGGGIQQGASTLTMQVVRSLSQDRERSLHRKVREAAMALAIDDHLGKDGVLQVYLDAPYLGQNGSFSICGFQAAARHYWGVEAEDLTLGQSATLAAILPAPGRFAPDRYPDLARERRDRVLRSMQEAGWDAVEVAAALAEPVQASPHPLPEPLHPAYLQAARSWLEGQVPVETLYGAGLDVWTPLDLVAQTTSEKTIPDKLAFLERAVGRRGNGHLEAAGVLLDTESGLMVAAYGGTVAQATDFSRATQAKRQAGSSIKPLVYALAFSRTGPDGKPLFTAAHTEPNAPRTFPNTNGWRPRNVAGEYTTTATLAYGLSWSQNIATASLLEELGGPGELVGFARKLGYDTTSWPVEMGLALGQAEVTPLEMARLAATVARGGRLASGRPVLTAVDAGGRRVVAPPTDDEVVLSPDAAALTRDLMRLVVEYGTGGASRGAGGLAGYPGPAIGKTGTTDSEKDLWYVGATPTYAGAIWLGYDQPARIGASASDLAAPLWGWWMHALHEHLPMDREFGGQALLHRAVCRETGLWGNGTCRLIGAPFLEGTTPRGGCPVAHAPPEEKKKYEGLWKRRDNEKQETMDSDGSAPDGEPGTAAGSTPELATEGGDGPG